MDEAIKKDIEFGLIPFFVRFNFSDNIFSVDFLENLKEMFSPYSITIYLVGSTFEPHISRQKTKHTFLIILKRMSQNYMI